MANGWALNEFGASLICQTFHDEGFARYGSFFPNIGKKSEITEQKKEEVSKSVSMELRSPHGVFRYSSHQLSGGLQFRGVVDLFSRGQGDAGLGQPLLH